MKKKVLSMLLALSMTATLSCVNVLAEVTTTSKLPTEINLITHHSNNNATKLNISWRNPDYEISAIEVTEPTLGTVSAGKTIDTTAKAYNNFWVEGLTDGTIYTFTVKITKADGNIEQYVTTGKAVSINLERNTEEAYGTKWNYKYEGRHDGSAYFIDSVEKYAGNSSLKVVNNDPSKEKYITSEDFNVRSLELGKTYEYSFYTKIFLSGGSKGGIVYWTNQHSTNGNENGTYYAGDSGEWVKNTYILHDIELDEETGTYQFKIKDITGTVISDQNNIPATYYGADRVGTTGLKFYPRLKFSGGGVAWIDNVGLYEVSEDGTLGKNLFAADNFGFEYGGAKAVSVTKGDASATIKWTNPISANITEAVVVDETNTPVSTASTTSLSSGASNSVAVTGLTNNTMYKYSIRLVINGVTEFIPVTFVPEASANPQINEDGYILNGWYISSQSGTLWSAGTKREFYIDSDAHSGTGSFKIYSKGGGNNWGYLKRSIYNLGVGNTYKLSLYAKATTQANNVHIGSGDAENYIKNIAATANADTWTYFESGVITANSGGAIDIRIYGDDYNGTYWIDDMVLTPVDAEGNATGEPIVIDDFDYNEFGNVIAIPNSEIATITWINPNNQNITEVYVTDAVGGRVAEGLSTTANGKVSAKVSGLTVGKTETFHIYATIANGAKLKKTVTFTAGKNLPFESTMYTYPEQHFKNEVLQTKDTEVKYSGNSSLKLQSNYVNGYSCLIIPCYNLDTTKKYEVSFMYKSEGMSGSAFWASDDWGTRTPLTFNSDWKKATVKWAGKANLLIRLGLECSFDALWIDDVVVREIDDEGNYLSDNLLTDGGFEATKDKISPITFSEADGNVTANITEYNGFGLGYYLASYDADGKLIDVELVNADNVGKLVQTLTPSVTNGATVKAFVWDGMSPVATATK